MGIFKYDKNQLIALLLSIGLFLIFGATYKYSRIFDGLENGAIDFRFRMREPFKETRKLGEGITSYKRNPRAREDIVICAIDEDTLKTFSQEEDIRWPFPWEIHKTVTRYIAADNPVAIFFDIMFLDNLNEEKYVSGGYPLIPGGDVSRFNYQQLKRAYNPLYFFWFRAQEREFARTIKEANCVFLDYPFHTEESFKTYPDFEQRMSALNKFAFDVPKHELPTGNCDSPNEYERDARCPWVFTLTPPTPLLSHAAKGLGFANVKPDADSVNRKLPLVILYKHNDKYRYYPSIDLLLAMHYYGIGMKDVEIKMGHYIKLKNLPAEKMKKPNKQREIAIPIDHQGFMDINFIGGPGSFDVKSYYYFNREPDRRGNFKNKIVFIAAYNAAGIAMDVHKSPFGDTFGVEHHANALNTILNQDFIYRLSDNQNILILLIIAILLGLVISKASIVKSITFTVAFSLIYLIGAMVIFDIANVVIIFAVPLLQIGTTFSLITAYRVLTEQKEKKYIRQTFSKFVSHKVVDELLAHPEKLKLGGEKKILTVLFSDIRGFTTISEALSPEALVDHLNVYLQAMTDIVLKYDGTLDKYVGDEIMAFWGAPIPQEDHAFRACQCAIEMMEVLNKMNQMWKVEGKPPLDIGIGINTGEMVVGNMGSSSRMDYTLMGDNVNLGARLEGTNKQYKTHIIISEFTYEHVKERVIARELDLVRVKGKELPVKIYELLDIK
ncbi:MAG: adenylate/guanylate cyclase domain-containing protein [Spirochaetes bacterium]|nr:adenylate/guanylate cyclase domain-containing protein [Spirochaetota bacterium]